MNNIVCDIFLLCSEVTPAIHRIINEDIDNTSRHRLLLYYIAYSQYMF